MSRRSKYNEDFQYEDDYDDGRSPYRRKNNHKPLEKRHDKRRWEQDKEDSYDNYDDEYNR